MPGSDVRATFVWRRWLTGQEIQFDEQGFAQGSFNNLPAARRVENTRDLLANLGVLVGYADGLVVSGNSNMGQWAMMTAEPEDLENGRIRSVDFPFFPTVFQILGGPCDGSHPCTP